MGIYTGSEVASGSLKTDTYVWAYNYELSRDCLGIKYKSKPVYGIVLSDTQPDRCLYDYEARYFAPVNNNNIIYDKAVSVKSRNFADTEQEAISEYNKLVGIALNKANKMFFSKIQEIKDSYIK